MTTRSRAYRWLAVVPALGLLGGISFANRVQPQVLGLPFLLFWIVGWVVATSAIMGLILALDTAHESKPEASLNPDAVGPTRDGQHGI